MGWGLSSPEGGTPGADKPMEEMWAEFIVLLLIAWLVKPNPRKGISLWTADWESSLSASLYSHQMKTTVITELSWTQTSDLKVKDFTSHCQFPESSTYLPSAFILCWPTFSWWWYCDGWLHDITQDHHLMTYPDVTRPCRNDFVPEITFKGI